MISPELSENEVERLKNLNSYNILDTLPEKEYDEITYLASQICGTPISLISLIDKDRQWFKSNHGLGATETPREYAFCAHAINDQENILIVPDSRIDERFHDNPLVTDNPFVIFHAGIPLITPQGFPLGTLCVIDNVPRTIDEPQIKALNALANQLIQLLELRLSVIKLSESETQLKELNATKDRLFAVVGHDLIGPIGSFKSLIDLLVNSDLNNSEELLSILQLMQKSASSTYELLENLLAWAKLQQNAIMFFPQKIKLDSLISKTLYLYAEALKNKSIHLVNNIPENTLIFADRNMIMSVLRNLISNAIKFTPSGKKITLSVASSETEVIISVTDEGTGIKSENLNKLFNKSEYFTTYGTNGEKGSGLGLILCNDFVTQHKGKFKVESIEGEGSSFIFSLPINN